MAAGHFASSSSCSCSSISSISPAFFVLSSTSSPMHLLLPHPSRFSNFLTSGCRVLSMNPRESNERGGWRGWGAFGGPPSFPSSSSRIMASTISPKSTSEVLTTSNDSAGPLPDKRVLVGVGTITMDFLACVDSYPEPDAKIRSFKSLAQGGGNVGNALTAAALLGLEPRILSKLANDASGIGILEELKSVGVDVSHVVVSEDGVSPFTYVIVDEKTSIKGFRIAGSKRWGFDILHGKTRTCIHTPGYPILEAGDLHSSAITAFLDGADLLYLDGRLPDATVIVAEEARRRGLPIILDAERKRERLDEMLPLADYLVTSAKFPQIWTEDSTLPEAMMSLVAEFPRVKFLIVTQGSAGCLMFERSSLDTNDVLDPDGTVSALQKEAEQHQNSGPIVLSSKFGVRKTSNGMVVGRFVLGTVAPLSAKEVVDTTGAGDAFIGGIAYGILADFPPEKMLPLGAVVAAAKCQELGARTGLPNRNDPRLHTFLQA